ncbi:MAG: hypothetical protein SV966_01675 [Actinomycetota bacterium]|nr:hypothetical protein [Actinomycetota bacterium]
MAARNTAARSSALRGRRRLLPPAHRADRHQQRLRHLRDPPSPVGTDGTAIVGTSPDGAKDITALLFTEGPAVARLEFQGAPGDPSPPDAVTDIGIKQAIALRVGLPGVTG